MKINFQDPAIAISLGVVLIGLAFFIWAVGKLFKKASPLDDSLLGSETLPPSPSGADELFSARQTLTPEPNNPLYKEFGVSPDPDIRPSPGGKERTVAPSVSKEMVERLDNMTLRLTDMQAVLQRQGTTAAAGSPMSPETIDKLLKIISSVTQQVDFLQRSLGAAPAAASPPSAAPMPTGQTSLPTGQAGQPSGQASTPKPAPSSATPPVRGIGVAGGALSRQAPAQKPTPAPGSAASTPPPEK